MIKTWCGFLLALLFIISCKSTETQSVVDTDVYSPLPSHLAWKISGNELSETSYLYGTMHIIPADKYFLPPGVPEAMKAAEQYVFEIDMAEMSDISAMMGMISKAFMNDGKRLGDLLSDEDMRIVKNHFDNKGLPLVMLDRIKPMFLTIFAEGDFNPDMLNDGSTKSYETEFMSQASLNNIPVKGLETIDYQISIFELHFSPF